MRNISLDKLKPGEIGYIKSVDMNKSQKIRDRLYRKYKSRNTFKEPLWGSLGVSCKGYGCCTQRCRCREN